MSPGIEVVYFTAIAALLVVLLLWFILAFVPSVLGLKDRDKDRF